MVPEVYPIVHGLRGSGACDLDRAEPAAREQGSEIDHVGSGAGRCVGHRVERDDRPQRGQLTPRAQRACDLVAAREQRRGAAIAEHVDQLVRS